MRDELKSSKVREEIRAFNVRLPKNLWKFLKTTSVEQDISMSEIIKLLIEKYKKSYER